MEYVDSRIDLNGEILIAKEAQSTRTTPIDLQWMVMTCDPESVERETCDELPVSCFVQTQVYLCLDLVCLFVRSRGKCNRRPSVLFPALPDHPDKMELE